MRYLKRVKNAATCALLLVAPGLLVAGSKPTVLDLAKLQNPAFYNELEELKRTGNLEFTGAVIDIPNGYLSNVSTTGAGHIGETYVVYYPDGRGALLAHTNWHEAGTPIEFFEHKEGKMVKIKSLLPDLTCASLSSAAARDAAYRLVKQKDWLKKFRVFYDLPRTGTTISAYCSLQEDFLVLQSILQESKTDSDKFDAALKDGGPINGLFSIRAEFRWNKKTGTFSRVK